MAENPLLALYGHDYEPAGPAGDPNSAGYTLEGPARPLSTADVLASLKSDSVVTRPMRGLAELLRAGARGPEDIPTPTHGKLVPFLLNAGAGGFDTAANWLDQRPKIGPDTIAPLGGMAAIAPITAVHGAAGVFGGRLAKTADHEALSRAELMAEHSFPRENIWKDTGWFQGRDGKWRFEIDDSSSRFNEVGNSVGDYLTHPGGMFKAYREVPGLGRDLGDIPLLRSGNANEGAYLRGGGVPPIEIVQVGKGSTDPRSVALHEYQHAIQQREGFARGANPGTYAGEHDALANPDAFQKYLRTAGEVEARNVQSRKDMTPSERRNVPPWETQDVADADQILRADNARASLPGVVVEGAAGSRPVRTLEEYVDKLAQRPSVLDYETYLSDPLRTINGRSRTFETQEPQFKREVSQEAKNLSHWRNMDSLREKRDAGLMAGPEGSPVNPWYWPAPMFDAFKRELGDDLAHDRLSKFMNYNASTSMQTAVPRNIIEAWHVLHHDLNGIPINKLNNAELTGAATANKVNISGDIASGEGIKGETAHKIRNYSLNLHGVGTAQPEYAFKPGGEAERLLSPATLDSIMAEAMRLRTKAGEPSERFKGPIYREGVSTINKLGDEVGAAAADTQAAIWQQHQFAKHGTGVYQDSYARIFDDVIHRVAAERGEDPNKVLADLMHGRERPPNFFTLAADNARASLPGTIVNGLAEVPSGGRSLPKRVLDALDPTGPGTLPPPGPFRLVPYEEARQNPARYRPSKEERMAESAERGDPWAVQQLHRIPPSLSDLTIMRGDKPIGGIDYDVFGAKDWRQPDTAHIHGINISDAAPLSVGEMRALREAFRELHPGVTHFEGFRVSGAKERNDHPNKVQSVVMRADNARASLPGTIVNGVEQGQPIRAYHGTGSDFDRFDFSKIGSGEGNQVYGHGLYFAEEPKVAADYRKRLGGDSNAYLEYLVKTPHGTELTIPGRGKDLPEGVAPELHHAANLFYHDGKRKAQAYAKQWLADAQEGKGVYPDRGIDYHQKLHDYVRQMKPGDVNVKRGRTYEVDLHANPAQFLDWNLPLKKQGDAVQDVMRPFADERATMMNDARQMALARGTNSFGQPLALERVIELSKRANPDTMTGEQLYNMWDAKLGAQRKGDKAAEASQQLQEQGITGIRYWDQASRSKKSGTSNYVMFPGTEDLIEIMKKYGLAAPVAGGAASGALRDSSSPDAGQ